MMNHEPCIMIMAIIMTMAMTMMMMMMMMMTVMKIMMSLVDLRLTSFSPSLAECQA